MTNMKKISLKLLVISYWSLVNTNISFAQVLRTRYPASCPSEAQAIVDAVGGCSAVDKDKYLSVYEKCCALLSPPNSISTATALWIVAVVLALGFAVAGMLYYSHMRKKP